MTDYRKLVDEIQRIATDELAQPNCGFRLPFGRASEVFGGWTALRHIRDLCESACRAESEPCPTCAGDGQTMKGAGE